VSLEYCVVSIGALSHNRLWGETSAVRTAHATTTLVSEESRLILVDPSLPPPVLAARLGERTGKSFADVTDVFCTTLRPVHRRGVEAFASARWWCSEDELEAYRRYLEELESSAGRLDAQQVAAVEADLKLVRRFQPAPEKFSKGIHLYPLTGPSAGSAGLLLAQATLTVLVAGDAALTAEHLQRGMVWEGCADAEAAGRSLQDILEVADVIIPGHDNMMLSPGRWI